MTYYYCMQCGVDEGCFPQVYVMLNSEIIFDNEDYHKQFDNDFENKFKEIVKEVAKENNISVNKLYRVSAGIYLKEVYNRYARWIFDTQKHAFCSINCAQSWLENNKEKGDIK